MNLSTRTLQPASATISLQQARGLLESALGLSRHRRSEVRRDVAQRPLEVGRHLAGVPAGRAARDALALDQQHAPARVAQQEEGRRHTRDPGPDDDHVGTRVGGEGLRWPVLLELGDPGRAVRLMRRRRGRSRWARVRAHGRLRFGRTRAVDRLVPARERRLVAPHPAAGCDRLP